MYKYLKKKILPKFYLNFLKIKKSRNLNKISKPPLQIIYKRKLNFFFNKSTFFKKKKKFNFFFFKKIISYIKNIENFKTIFNKLNWSLIALKKITNNYREYPIDFLSIYNFNLYKKKIKKFLWWQKISKFFYLLHFNVRHQQIKYLCRDLGGETYTAFSTGIILKDVLKTEKIKQYRKGVFGSRIFWERFKKYIKESKLNKRVVIISLFGLRQTFLRILKNLLSKKMKLRILYLIHKHGLPYDKKTNFKKSIYIKRRVKKRITSRINSTNFFSKEV